MSVTQANFELKKYIGTVKFMKKKKKIMYNNLYSYKCFLFKIRLF